MSTPHSLAALVAAWLVLDPGSAAHGQATQRSAMERIELSVSALSGNSAYLDQGANAGLEVGDRVRILLLGGATIEGTVRAVSSQAARAEFPQGLAGVQVGDRGEVDLPASRRAAHSPPDGPPSPAPVHPPWNQPEGEWEEGMPLLAPVEAREAEDRPRSVRGKAYLRGDWGSDNEDGSDNSLLWLGGSLDVDNPFGQGGELALDLDAYSRQFDGEEDSEDESRVRIERLSYTVGGVRGRPNRIELGRFLQDGVPEFGVLDGAEWERRLPSGDSLGLSFGFLPEWQDAMTSGDNLALAGFYRYVANDDGVLSSTVGAQKTWFQGAADRDLLVWSADYRPFDRTFLHASTWVDFYSGGDDKSGAELTQALLTATQSFESGSGFAVTATRYSFPDLLRDDLFTATEEELSDGEVSRLSVRGWRPVTESLEVNAQASAFTDQDDSGGSLELGVAARDLLYPRGTVSLSIYDVEGKFTSGAGVRASALKAFDSGTLRLDFDLASYDEGALEGADSLAHDRARLAWERSFGVGWSVSLSAEQRFGDQQSSSSLGFYLERRF